MVGIASDARASVPPEGSPRLFIAYTGSYRLDGDIFVTHPDDASRPELIVDQVRRVEFDGPNRMTVVPVSGVPGYGGIDFVWERIG